MEETNKPPQQKARKRDNVIKPIYSRALITRKIMLPITSIGKTIQRIIEQNISSNYEGKCLVEGYIKPNSSKIVTFSSGKIEKGIYAVFEVVFECEVCFPVEGTKILCVAKNITKAGIRAESAGSMPSPVVVFIARDHHYNNSYFSTIQEGDNVEVRVIGQRFELNDKYVSVIGELIPPKPENRFEKSKPKIVF